MYGTTAISLGEKNIKKVLQIAALLDTGSEIRSPAKMALDLAIELALNYAKSYVKGNTEVLFCEPSQAKAVASNPEFFRALCEEGVIEWLEPLVLAGKVNRSGNVQT
jgi:hypothetical protein